MTLSLSIGIGLVASFFFTEVTGLYGGGLVVPGYIALYLDQPARVAATLALALTTYAVVWAASHFIIMYGRRRFMAMVLVAFWLGWLFGKLGIGMYRAGDVGQEFRAIGYIIPGLIANDVARQGVVRTFAAVVFLSAVVRLALVLVR
ncbi:MAG: poly-gamma-glutamate biosynthesis protein PgsC [Firmicutes bacterium]|nr:poly-gamma-glutamate biosynthesis protein PgsC [Bacillota bacterium]